METRNVAMVTRNETIKLKQFRKLKCYNQKAILKQLKCYTKKHLKCYNIISIVQIVFLFDSDSVSER
jgi:hypothetical protein